MGMAGAQVPFSRLFHDEKKDVLFLSICAIFFPCTGHFSFYSLLEAFFLKKSFPLCSSNLDFKPGSYLMFPA